MRTVLAGLGLILALCAPAWAEDGETSVRRAVIVLDRGEAAEATHRTDIGNALRVWAALAKRGVDCRLLAAGVDGDGSTLVDDVPPTRPGLMGLASRPVFAFRGPTDVRAVLSYVLAEDGKTPVDILFLGPFDPGSKDGEAVRDKVVAAWNEEAPEGSRLLAVRCHELGRGLLAEARGLACTGRLVVGFDEPTVETQPFSPFRAEADGIEATIGVVADVLALQAKVTHTPLLQVTSDVKADRVSVTANAGLHAITLRRQPGDGRTATLSFAKADDLEGVHWLVAPPDPLTFRWEDLAKEARLVDTDGKPAPPFAAIDVEVGTPKRVTLRLMRTRTGPAPAWRARVEEGTLPAGLTITVGDEVQVTPEVGEADVRIGFEAKAGVPLEAQGTIVIEADGVAEPVRLPFEIRVRAGAVTLESDIKPAALPASAAEPRTTVTLVAKNANAPKALQLRAVCDGGQEKWLRGLIGTPGGSVTRWDLTTPLVMEVGEARTIAFDLEADAPPELVWPCTVTILPEALSGVVLDGRVDIVVRKRRPRIELGGPPPTFTLEQGTLRSDTPFILRLDPDGGDGDYLLDLIKAQPSLISRGGSIGWQAVPRGQGVWHIVPTGEWQGAQPAIFRDQEEHVDLEIAWTRGRTPGAVAVPVEVPARWGKRGFVLLTLALLALVLALLVIGYMRTPPLKGVLLYTVDGLKGTVGRLELAAGGRKTRLVLADDKGKLSLGAKGNAIAKVRPTRVGGMLEYTDAHGQKERRLLVDGVSLRLGRHLVRYVYGRPQDDELPPMPPESDDLLGPEFDIESGKIDALGDD